MDSRHEARVRVMCGCGSIGLGSVINLGVNWHDDATERILSKFDSAAASAFNPGHDDRRRHRARSTPQSVCVPTCEGMSLQ